LSKYKPLAFSSFIRSLAFASTARRKLPLPDMSFDEKFHNLSKKGKEKSSLESSDEEDSQGDVQAGFVDLILNQTALGTVVKVADDEDEALFALITALNLARYKENKCFRELKEFLLKVCSEKNVASDLELLLEKKAKDVGLLVSQRVMNLPLQLLPPLYDGLFDEVSWATEDEPTEELRGSFRFKSYILIAKIYKVSVLVRLFFPVLEFSFLFQQCRGEEENEEQYNLSLKMKFFSSLALGHSYYLCTRSLLHLKRFVIFGYNGDWRI